MHVQRSRAQPRTRTDIPRGGRLEPLLGEAGHSRGEQAARDGRILRPPELVIDLTRQRRGRPRPWSSLPGSHDLRSSHPADPSSSPFPALDSAPRRDDYSLSNLTAQRRGGVPGGDDTPGALVRPVARAVHDAVVAGVDEPVRERLGDNRVREQIIPVGRRPVAGQDRRFADTEQNADPHQLLKLCAMTGTIISDQDGLYHPRNFNDSLPRLPSIDALAPLAVPGSRVAIRGDHISRLPPSTVSTSPVTHEARSLQRKRAALAMSSGWPMRFIGHGRGASSRPGSHRARAKSVFTSPGAMAFTRTVGPNSEARCFVRCISPALVML